MAAYKWYYQRAMKSHGGLSVSGTADHILKFQELSAVIRAHTAKPNDRLMGKTSPTGSY